MEDMDHLGYIYLGRTYSVFGRKDAADSAWQHLTSISLKHLSSQRRNERGSQGSSEQR